MFKMASTSIILTFIKSQIIHFILNIGCYGGTYSRNYKMKIFWFNEMIKRLQICKALIIDKISMISAKLLITVFFIFFQFYNCILPFVRLHMLAFKDFMQLLFVNGFQVFKLPIWQVFIFIFLT